MNKYEMIQLAMDEGFSAAALIGMDKVVFDPVFRPFCEENLCAQYGANYSCPPDCGTPEEMERRLSIYKDALVFQSKWNIHNKFNSMRCTSRHHRSIGVLPRHVRMRTSRACNRQLIPVCLTLQFVKPVELQERIDMALRRSTVSAPRANKVSVRVEFADDGVVRLQKRFSVRTFHDAGFAVKGFVSIQAGQFIDLLKHDVLPPFLWCDFMFEFLQWVLKFKSLDGEWCGRGILLMLLLKKRMVRNVGEAIWTSLGKRKNTKSAGTCSRLRFVFL